MKEFPHVKRGDRLELEITGSAFEGKSIARFHGIVVFVEGGVPGDLVTAEVTKAKKNLVEAQLLELKKPSAFRVDPRCIHFGVCGGCKWQHVKYQAQLQFKQQHVVDSFERIGGFPDVSVQPIIGAGDIFFYRNKMEFSFSDQEWFETPPAEATPKGIFLGLHVPQRFDKILDLKECHLQSDVSNEILALTRAFARENNAPVYATETDSGYLRFLVIRQSKRTKELMVNLVTRTDDRSFMESYANMLRERIPQVTTIVNTLNTRRAQVAYGEEQRVYWGEGVIHERLGDRTFIISAGSFFQTNTAQAERLYAITRELGEFRSPDIVYDLYSGTGTIALFIASDVSRVFGVESVESALKDAERNSQANGVTNCEFVLGDLKDRLTKDTDWMSTHPRPDVVILDPPRSGIHPKVIERLIEIGAPRIVYVSCNPATQARDVRLLCTSKYRLQTMQPVDMFPHTYHIENVALLVLK